MTTNLKDLKLLKLLIKEAVKEIKSEEREYEKQKELLKKEKEIEKQKLYKLNKTDGKIYLKEYIEEYDIDNYIKNKILEVDEKIFINIDNLKQQLENLIDEFVYKLPK